MRFRGSGRCSTLSGPLQPMLQNGSSKRVPAYNKQLQRTVELHRRRHARFISLCTCAALSQVSARPLNCGVRSSGPQRIGTMQTNSHRGSSGVSMPSAIITKAYAHTDQGFARRSSHRRTDSRLEVVPIACGVSAGGSGKWQRAARLQILESCNRLRCGARRRLGSVRTLCIRANLCSGRARWLIAGFSGLRECAGCRIAPRTGDRRLDRE
jgi:hypothetical protein